MQKKGNLLINNVLITYKLFIFNNLVTLIRILKGCKKKKYAIDYL